MIPTQGQCKALWDKYQLPEKKRIHVGCVVRTAMFLAQQINKATNSQINKPLLLAGALLHDIDKAVLKLPGEHHPDTAVRILQEEGMGEVAVLVRTHPLHAILDPAISPKTWEERLLYLADKMCKYAIITVDERFNLWRNEHLPADQQVVLDASYPSVKTLEKEVFSLIGIAPQDVARLA